MARDGGDYNPYSYYSNLAYQNAQYPNHGGSGYFSGFKPYIHKPTFVGKPIESYDKLYSALQAKTDNVLAGIDQLSIAMANENVAPEYKPIIQQKEQELRGTINDIIESKNFNVAGALMRKAAVGYYTDPNVIQAKRNTEEFKKNEDAIRQLWANKGIGQYQYDLKIRKNKESLAGSIDPNTSQVKAYEPYLGAMSYDVDSYINQLKNQFGFDQTKETVEQFTGRLMTDGIEISKEKAEQMGLHEYITSKGTATVDYKGFQDFAKRQMMNNPDLTAYYGELAEEYTTNPKYKDQILNLSGGTDDKVTVEELIDNRLKGLDVDFTSTMTEKATRYNTMAFEYAQKEHLAAREREYNKSVKSSTENSSLYPLAGEVNFTKDFNTENTQALITSYNNEIDRLENAKAPKEEIARVTRLRDNQAYILNSLTSQYYDTEEGKKEMSKIYNNIASHKENKEFLSVLKSQYGINNANDFVELIGKHQGSLPNGIITASVVTGQASTAGGNVPSDIAPSDVKYQSFNDILSKTNKNINKKIENGELNVYSDVYTITDDKTGNLHPIHKELGEVIKANTRNMTIIGGSVEDGEQQTLADITDTINLNDYDIYASPTSETHGMEGAQFVRFIPKSGKENASEFSYYVVPKDNADIFTENIASKMMNSSDQRVNQAGTMLYAKSRYKSYFQDVYDYITISKDKQINTPMSVTIPAEDTNGNVIEMPMKIYTQEGKYYLESINNPNFKLQANDLNGILVELTKFNKQ